MKLTKVESYKGFQEKVSESVVLLVNPVGSESRSIWAREKSVAKYILRALGANFEFLGSWPPGKTPILYFVRTRLSVSEIENRLAPFGIAPDP